jgi:Outer membrane protein beta-barrel domain
MRNLTFSLAACCVPAIIIPSFAAAKPLEPGQFSGRVSLGAPIFGSGNLHGSATTTIPSLTALNPALPAVPAVLDIGSRKFSKVYDAPAQFGVEMGYGLTDNVELFGGLNYAKTNGSRIQVGTATVAALNNAVLPTFGDFGDLKNLEFEGGARYFFSGETFSPYVGGSIGAVQQDSVKATFTIPDAPAGGITLANVPFFKKTTALSVGVEGGVSFGLSDTIDGRLSAGAKYIGAGRGDDTALSGLGLGTINNGSERWSYPLKATLAVRF